MVVRVSKRLIRVVVGKLIEEKGLEAAATSSSPDPGSTRATASGGDTSEAKWDFHTQEDDSEGERGSQTVSEPESKPAAMASKEEVAVEDKRIEMKEEAKEEGFLEVRKVSFQGLPYSGGSQIVFAELKIANMDTWNGSTDVIENVDSSFSWNTRLTGTVDLIRPEQRMLKLQARTLVGGKEKHLASADVSTAEIKAGLGQWVVVTGAMGNDNGEVCGEFSISARFRQASDNDVWEDAPATPRGHAAATHEEYDDDNYGESEFENDELGSTTKSKKTTTESEDDYANDFEGSISEKKSKVLPAAESAGDDEYGDDDYEDEYADDEFAEEEE
ncbi:unnamed protein product [Symbiodinium microadriaticum]|nr:unnamed protein product [Symbiodinium microadriaticum]